MKLSLTLEADSVNVQALNMGRIVVDVDGVNLAELINKVAENGYSLRVVDESLTSRQPTAPPFTALTGIRLQYRTYHGNGQRPAVLTVTSDHDFGESEWIHFTGSGYLLRTDAWSYPVLRLKRLGSVKTFRRLVVTLTRRYGVSLIHLDAGAECRVYPLSTGNRNNMKSLTTETALDILIAWLQDNIDCESGIIFDNDEDKTDSAALLPCIEQARQGIRTCANCSFCTRTGESYSPDFIPTDASPEYGWRFHL